MTVFEQVKAAVDVPTAARQYGLTVNRSGMVQCPFHPDKTASMKLYHDHYYCFGCAAHGDVIGLVGGLLGLSPIEAVRQLNQDLGLALDLDRPPDPAASRRIAQQRQARETYRRWEQHCFDVLREYVWLVRDWGSRYRPSRPEAGQDPRFVYALHHAGLAEETANAFLLADEAGRLIMRKEIERIETELRELSGK